jgi:hypothetical protein
MMHLSTDVNMKEKAVMIAMFLEQAGAVAEERQAEARRARLIRSVRQVEASRRRLARGMALPPAASGCCFES